MTHTCSTREMQGQIHLANISSSPISYGFYMLLGQKAYRVITEVTNGWPNKDFMNDNFSCVSCVS